MNQERIFQILRAPHISEKSTVVADANNQVVFEVANTASKAEIKAAVAAQGVNITYKLLPIEFNVISHARPSGSYTSYSGHDYATELRVNDIRRLLKSAILESCRRVTRLSFCPRPSESTSNRAKINVTEKTYNIA